MSWTSAQCFASQARSCSHVVRRHYCCCYVFLSSHAARTLVLTMGVVGISAMEEYHRYPLRVQQSKLDGWWFIFVDEVGLGVLGPNFEDLLDRLKVLAGNLFRERGETVADVEIVRSEKPALHVFH